MYHYVDYIYTGAKTVNVQLNHRILTCLDSPSTHKYTTAPSPCNNSSAFHVMTFIWWKLWINFPFSYSFLLFQPILSLAYTILVCFLTQCIIIVSVCLSLPYLYLKLECFIYLCMSFYIIIALDFVFQEHFSILSLHLSADIVWLF